MRGAILRDTMIIGNRKFKYITEDRRCAIGGHIVVQKPLVVTPKSSNSYL